ncbi:hypothetical protein [Chitinophaga sp.]|uniref:hypothetical protein n=1 Tax=Chitinophaga sp. TaxID=1869181 RepID=UPI0031DBF799
MRSIVFVPVLLFGLNAEKLLAQTPVSSIKIFDNTAPATLHIGRDADYFFLQRYSPDSAYLQESFRDAGGFHVVAQKFKSHMNISRVGINNPTPVGRLDVNGNMRANSALVMLGPGSYENNNFDDGANMKRGLYIDNSVSTSWEFLSLRNVNGEHFRINGNGYTGLGINPGYRLHLMQKDGSFAEGIGLTNGSITWNILSDGYGARLLVCQNGDPSKGMSLLNGNMGVGMDAPAGYRLAVNGTAVAKKVKVTETPWADFVFEPDYDLRPLPELEQYVQKNRHLPGIPTVHEVEREGIDLGEINAKLLQKIEELTLYLIEQNKEMKQMKQELAELKAAAK